jgi:hypothetical protein
MIACLCIVSIPNICLMPDILILKRYAERSDVVHVVRAHCSGINVSRPSTCRHERHSARPGFRCSPVVLDASTLSTAVSRRERHPSIPIPNRPASSKECAKSSAARPENWPRSICYLDLYFRAWEYGQYATSSLTEHRSSTSRSRRKIQGRQAANMPEVRQSDGMVQHRTQTRRSITACAYVSLPILLRGCARRRALASAVMARAVF